MQALEKMKVLKIRVIICTDLMARGVDLPDVRLVVNLDAPHTKEESLHRAGRACRWSSNPGLVLNFDVDGLQATEVELKVEKVVESEDTDRVERRVNKEVLLLNHNEQVADNVLVQEQAYKRLKMASNESKIGEWQSVTSSEQH
jgi:superfamily II DNA/RNA helicase